VTRVPQDEVLARRQELLTGERTAPGVPDEAYWFPRHLAAYAWVAREFAPVGQALDAGCGEGYGTATLRRAATFACGLELDGLTCHHAGSTYPEAGFVRGNLVELPFRSAAFDLVASMQVIEHLWDVCAYLREIVRVLVPGGAACISTPNRPTFSPGLLRGERPTNPFHVEEFDAEQLAGLLTAAGLVEVRVWGLTHGRRILAWEHQHGPVVPALIAAIGGRVSPAGMAEFVGTLDWQDFEIDQIDSVAVQDLIAVGRAP